MPHTRVRPTFWRWRVTSAGVVEIVMFATASWMRSSNQVVRHVNPSIGSTFRPISPPTSRSGPSVLLGSVTTVPTRNCRYSSLSVGARNPHPRSPHTLTRSASRYSAAMRGLATVSCPSGSTGSFPDPGRPVATSVSRLCAS